MKDIVFYLDIRAVEAAAKAVGSLNSRGKASLWCFYTPNNHNVWKTLKRNLPYIAYFKIAVVCSSKFNTSFFLETFDVLFLGI